MTTLSDIISLIMRHESPSEDTAPDNPEREKSLAASASEPCEAETDTSAIMEEFVARLEAQSNRLNYLTNELEEAHEKRSLLREEIEELRDENSELRAQITHLDERTDLLQLVQNSDELTGKQRSVALIQHLRRAAVRERDRGRDAKASVNRDEAERALQYPEVDRTTIYTDMQRAAKLVGNEDVLSYVSESGGGSRLKMNLESGDLDARFHTNNRGD